MKLFPPLRRPCCKRLMLIYIYLVRCKNRKCEDHTNNFKHDMDVPQLPGLPDVGGLLGHRLLKRTIPEKPNRIKQKYIRA